MSNVQKSKLMCLTKTEVHGYPIYFHCPTRQDDFLKKMGEKYPSKMMVFGANICQRPDFFVPLHCQTNGAARHHLPIGTGQDAHRLGTSSGRARRIVRRHSGRKTNVRNTRSTLVALHL